MEGDLLMFPLSCISPLIIIVNPLSTVSVFELLKEALSKIQKTTITEDSIKSELGIFLVFAITGSTVLQLFEVTLQALRFAGAVLLDGIGTLYKTDLIVSRTGQRERRANGRLMGMLLTAIACSSSSPVSKHYSQFPRVDNHG